MTDDTRANAAAQAVPRPPVPHDAPAGFEWRVTDADSLNWSLTAWQVGQRRCRYSESGVRCPNLAAVVLNRYAWNGQTRPWAYCAEHMFGRWIEDGKVVGWRLVRADGLSGGRALVEAIR